MPKTPNVDLTNGKINYWWKWVQIIDPTSPHAGKTGIIENVNRETVRVKGLPDRAVFRPDQFRVLRGRWDADDPAAGAGADLVGRWIRIHSGLYSGDVAQITGCVDGRYTAHLFRASWRPSGDVVLQRPDFRVLRAPFAAYFEQKARARRQDQPKPAQAAPMRPYLAQLTAELQRLTTAQLVDVITGIQAHLHGLSRGARGRDTVPTEEREAWLTLAPADLLAKVTEGHQQVEVFWREVMGHESEAQTRADSALHEAIKAAQRRAAAVAQATELAEREERLRQFAQGLLAGARAPATWAAYRRDWAHFAAWCAAQGHTAMPARVQTVLAYLTEMAAAGRPPAVATIRRRLAALAVAHQVAGIPSPTADPQVKELLMGIRRRLGTAQKKKAAAVTEDIRRMVATCDPERLLGQRDRALLLLGFAGAFRRSELVSLDVSDLEFTREGLVVTLRRSKTDQEGAGTQKGIPYGSNPETCPVEAVQAWLTAAGISAGPVFRGVDRHNHLLPGRLSDRAVARAVQRAAQAAGLDPARYGGHSLRAGLATSAAAGGAPDSLIADQTGHKSMQVLHGYIRRGSLFRQNAVRYTGL